MNIIVRVNFALGTAFLIAFLGLAFASNQLLKLQARRAVMSEAELMLASAVGVRNYTANEIAPLLQVQLQTEFPPQSVPFYAATQHFLDLRRQRPEYSYKEATLNPTNPRDRATDWEADIIQRFRDDPRLPELHGERDTPLGRVLYFAHPIQAGPECMECHSEPSKAPKTLITRYGSSNGFGWQPHEIVGAQLVSVAMEAAEANASHAWAQLLALFAAALGGLWLIANFVLYRTLVHPLRQIVKVADAVSAGEAGVDFAEQSAPEFNALIKAFERMRVSLEKAMKLLGS
jgi:protein-histidine pros-kinase